ncbi:cyclin-dependent kinase E-1 isoform X3 [Physcomitrium patens]|uniref:Protein kinase domain-containing protein n=2 Tax=Physcomitrium patens TaxID=3218 RepID=A0A7I4F9K4_PHYPA|nr:cyclin-dependent kinase E-1-like isoform X1 [Physcomitrium patens]XP_024356730.1 cyclin-dependent kinase E-1-like isoform X1 [Physcomitrium patens]XP_024356732.1 cyclin-dependent kinase E-1-like isoform X1 [Physcomitrium patens]|eukprot:XP_024356729.1 cyclin-dependent kinase E-1-like isoform X1 [Physcomitrella patens]
MVADGSGKQRARPEWLQQYDLVGKIGEGTYGLVYLAKSKEPAHSRGTKIAIKKFKQSKEGDGVSPTAIREIMLLRECIHENIVKLVNVHINHGDMSLYLAFDYAEHDLYEIIRHHREKINCSINAYTVKSLLWQILNGLNYLHSNWIIHRDLKPSNILVMGEGDEQGLVKIGDFGLARIFQAPLRSLSENGVVVTIWYRAPELLLGSRHYTSAVDMWAVGCIFAELLTLKPLFQGIEDKSSPNPFQLDQLDKIFKVLGNPTADKWPTLLTLPHWASNRQNIQTRKYDNPGLYSIVQLPPKSPGFDLLSKMLEYDPIKRITASQALEHDYFRNDPIPGRNSLVPPNAADKVVPYPQRPVDYSTDFDGTTAPPPPQMPNPSSMSGGSNQLHQSMNVNMQQQQHKVQNSNNMVVNPPVGMHGLNSSAGIYTQRGNPAVLLQQQQQQGLRRKEQSNVSYPGHYQPPNKSRRI